MKFQICGNEVGGLNLDIFFVLLRTEGEWFDRGTSHMYAVVL